MWVDWKIIDKWGSSMWVDWKIIDFYGRFRKSPKQMGMELGDSPWRFPEVAAHEGLWPGTIASSSEMITVVTRIVPLPDGASTNSPLRWRLDDSWLRFALTKVVVDSWYSGFLVNLPLLHVPNHWMADQLTGAVKSLWIPITSAIFSWILPMVSWDAPGLSGSMFPATVQGLRLQTIAANQAFP
jgi:hypothetical protein